MAGAHSCADGYEKGANQNLIQTSFLHTRLIVSDQRMDSKVILFSTFLKNRGYQIVQNLKKNQKNFAWLRLRQHQDFLYRGVRTIFFAPLDVTGSSYISISSCDVGCLAAWSLTM